VRLPHVKLKIWQMMVAVAIAALLLGVQETRRRWAAYRREAAYHANCERHFSLMAARRFGELPRVPLRADVERKFYSLSTKLTRPREWADSCRSFAADHRGQKIYWETRW